MKINQGILRLVISASIILGSVVVVVSENRVTWSKFLEKEAFHNAHAKEFPDRDPKYLSTSETPKWEDSVSTEKYDSVLNSLINSKSMNRFMLKVKYHSEYALIPFFITFGSFWLIFGCIHWIYSGFKKPASQNVDATRETPVELGND